MAQTCKVVVKERLSLGGSRYDYIGTLTFAEYKGSGGNPITDVTGAVTALPAIFDHISFGNQGGYQFEYVPGTEPKFKAYGSNKTDSEPGKEVADKADLKALSVTFRGTAS